MTGLLRTARRWYVGLRYGDPPDCARCGESAAAYMLETLSGREVPVCLDCATFKSLENGLGVLRDLDRSDYE